jgi:polysaccharide export outer membrane protein
MMELRLTRGTNEVQNDRGGNHDPIVSTACSAAIISILLIAVSFSSGAVRSPQQDNPPRGGDYRIGSKDLLEIKIYELPELNQTVRVAEDGSISLSLIGKVMVAGLSAQELEKKLASILNEKSTKDAHVTVFIKEYQKIAVLGAVGRPGLYEMIGPTSLLKIISQAGGFTAEAMNELYVYRRDANGKKLSFTINIQALFAGNQDLDIDLQPNDEVIVPIDQTSTVFIYGEVKNPGLLTFKKSKGLTLVQAVAQAGGPAEWASTSRIAIKRNDKTTGKERLIEASLNKIIKGGQDVPLEDGDVVIVH